MVTKLRKMNLISIVLLAAGAAAALSSSARSNDQQNGAQGENGLGNYGHENYGKVGKYDQYGGGQQAKKYGPKPYSAGQYQGSQFGGPRSGQQDQSGEYNPEQYEGGQQGKYEEGQNGPNQHGQGQNQQSNQQNQNSQYRLGQQGSQNGPNQYGAGQNQRSYIERPRSGQNSQAGEYNPAQNEGGQQGNYGGYQNGPNQYGQEQNQRSGQEGQSGQYTPRQYGSQYGPNQPGPQQGQRSYLGRQRPGQQDQNSRYNPEQYQGGQQGKYKKGQNGPNQYGQGQNQQSSQQSQSGQYTPGQYGSRSGPNQPGSQQGQYSNSGQPRLISENLQTAYEQKYRFDEPGLGVYDSAAYYNQQLNVGVDDINQNAAVAQRLVPDEEREPPTDNDFGLSNIDPDILEELKMFEKPVFAFYHKGSPKPQLYQLRDAEKILKNPKYNKAKKTMVYIHGFIEGLFSDSIKDVVKTYLDNDDYNVLIMDWHWYAAPPYFLKAVPNVQKVGVKVARALMDMLNSGLTTQNLHVVGHSLGGQMAGVIGRTIQKESGGGLILERITALDPAFPGFYGIPNVQPLNEYDAEYVDVLHTDVGVYGAPVSTGTVDFWPNGGLPPQPGCITNLCSHQRSWWYWGGSVLKNATNYFSAVKAKSWWSFRDGDTEEFDPKVAMGISCPSGLYGNYYLVTNDKLPYARGNDGISYAIDYLIGSLPPTPLLQSKPAVVPDESFF